MERLDTLPQAFEEHQDKLLQNSAFEEVREEYSEYFKALAKHPRMLVNAEVPALMHDGMEKLKDSADAKEWQEAVKSLLLEEVTSRVATRKEEAQSVFSTVHESINMFRNNRDLIPGTKGFDKELADELVVQLKDYELRSDGKLVGYTVPVQPIINALRSKVVAGRVTPAQQVTPTARQQAVAEQPRNSAGQWDGPQAGITSRAGSSSDTTNEGAGVLEAFFRQNGA